MHVRNTCIIHAHEIFMIIFMITEEIERREKAFVDELNFIELQIGLGKHPQNFEESTPLNTVEASHPIEEGEENRDPNPEHTVESTVEIDNATVSIQPIINENFDNNHDMEMKEEEIQFDQVPLDENND